MVMEISCIGVEHRHLPLTGADNPRMAVTNVRDIIDRVQLSPAGFVVQILHMSPLDFKRFAI
jgi:hypothetical protein